VCVCVCLGGLSPSWQTVAVSVSLISAIINRLEIFLFL